MNRFDPAESSSMAAIARDYTVVLSPGEPDEGGFCVTVPALPEIATQGETVEEALEMARDAIALSLVYRRDKGLPIPDDAPPRVEHIHVTIEAA